MRSLRRLRTAFSLRFSNSGESRFLLLALFSLLLFAQACSKPSARWLGSVKTVRGVVIVNNPLVPLFGEPCFTAGEEVRYEDSELSPRFSYDVGEDGRLYLIDWAEYRVRIYDVRGTLLQKIGRYGQGPGEMQMPAGLSVDSHGEIQVLDFSPRRLISYSYKGEYLRQTRLPIDALVLSIKPLKDGDYVAHISTRGENNELRRYRKDLAGFVSLMKREHEPSPKGEIRFTLDDILFAADSEGSVICGTGERYELLVWDYAGKVVRKITKALINEPFPEYAKKQEMELISSNPWFRKYKIFFPPAKPSFIELATNDDGLIFVRVYGPKDSNVLEIFNKGGIYLGDAQLPHRIAHIIVKRNRIYGFIYDEDGNPIIKSYGMIWNPRFKPAVQAALEKIRAQ